jgi:signal transduction histidine kinase
MFNNETSNPNLGELLDAMAGLQSQKLPRGAQKYMEKALKSLDGVIQEVTSGEEQTRLAALYRVSQVLGTSLDLDEVLNQVIDAVIGLTEAERGFLMLVEGDTKELNVRAGRNMEQETLEGKAMEVSRTVIRTVLDSGTGVVTTNAQKDPRFSGQESVVIFGLRSIMCAPLRARGEVIGVVYVDNRAQVGLFTDEDLEMLNAFASQAAAAIENARLYTHTDQSLADRVQELESLARFARVLNTQENVNEVLETTQKWALEGTEAEEVWIATLGRENGRQKITVAVGPETGRELAMEHPLLRPVLTGNTPHIFEPKNNEPARLAVPILGPEDTIGILVAESPNSFPVEDMQFLVRLANQAAVAFGKVNLYERVQEAKLEKAKFVSVVSHELRLPMTSIMGYTDLLKQGMTGVINEQQLKFLTVIRENVGRMSALISDLSDIYKVESGKLHLEPIALPMRGMVERAVEAHQEELGKKSQRVSIHVAGDLPRVYGDPNRVEQILANLVDNASRYSPEGGEIEIRGKVVGNVIHTSIKDQGIGISKEDQSMLFTQFFRAERTEVREQKGWGLGLSVVKNLVGLMGGEVGFESELEKGSTFWFTLPVVER